jgi:hypothetical protein
MGQAKRADWKRGPSPWKGAALGAVIEKPEHAYGIAARLQHRLPGADLAAGDIYPVMRRLLDAGLVDISARLPEGQTQARVTYASRRPASTSSRSGCGADQTFRGCATS